MNSSDTAIDKPLAAPLADRAPDYRLVDRLLWFFALVYIVEGLGQVVGLVVDRPALSPEGAREQILAEARHLP